MSFDPIPLMTPVTKWAARVLHTDRIPEYVDAAWRIMLAGRPGPAFLELPVDVLGAETSPEALGRRHAATHFGPGVSQQAVASVDVALSGARRPLLIAGDDVRWTEAGGLLERWIEREGAPFALARLARGVVSERHPLCAGIGYLPANRTLRQALGEADLVLLLGHTWEFDLGFGDTIPGRATVIQVHPDEALVGKNLVPSIGVTARADELLRALLDRPTNRPTARDVAWAEQVGADWRGERAGQLEAARGSGAPMHPLTLVEELVATAPPDTIWVTSHGNVDFWADQAIQAHGVDGYLRAGQSGSLGAEVPYGVAAKLARPERPVVVFVGDGGFGFHGFELETAARYGAPVVVVVADDERWGAIALPQERAYGVQVEMDLPGRDWAQLATTLGARGERARRPEEVGPALRRLLEAGVPGVLHASIACVESPYMRVISGA